MSNSNDFMSRRAPTEGSHSKKHESPFKANGEDNDSAKARTSDNAPTLGASTSFDSDNDSGAFHLTMAPLHALQASLTPPDHNNWSQEEDLVQGHCVQRALFPRVEADVDDDDFEILPDDDDIGDDAAKRDGKVTIRRRSSAPFPKTTTTTSTTTTTTTTQLCTPPRSPVVSPSTSPPTSPLASIGNVASRISAGLSLGGGRHQIESDQTIDDKGPVGGSHRRIQSANDDFPLRSPITGTFRAIRARAMAAYKGSDSNQIPSVDPSMATDDWVQDDGSSSEELSEQSLDVSSDEESGIFEDEVDDAYVVNDFSSIPPMPNSFLGLPPDLYDYLDPELVRNIKEQKISTFAYEHHLLVKGLLQLLAERDIVGVEGDIHDTSNVIKMGPLKKRSTRGLWSVKYVEIRRGNLSYFSDEAFEGGDAPRKTIHLRKQTCRCEPAAEPNTNIDGYLFELMVEGGPRKIWMAKSEEERQGWIRAINQAMIGEAEGLQDTPVDLSLYLSAIEAYKSVQLALQQVESRADYLVAVDSLLYRKSASSALRVPMTWVREEVTQGEKKKDEFDNTHASVKHAISETWRCLFNTTVDINGYIISAATAYSAERVIGTLSRCILEFDRVDEFQIEAGISSRTVKRSGKDAFMTELEAVSYARSILLGALRGQSQGDVMSAIQNLVENERIAYVELEKTEPLHIDVSFAGDDFQEREQSPYDISGWVNTRPKRARVWKKHFFILSEGVLSFFAEAEPRPYGLRGQIVVDRCLVTTLDDTTLVIQLDEEERLLQFEDRGQLLKWRNALERAADPENLETQRESSHEPVRRRGKRAFIVSTVTTKPLKTATDTGVKVGMRAMKAMKDAKVAGMKKIKNARGIIVRGINAGLQRSHGAEAQRRKSTQAMLMMSTRGLSGGESQKRDPTVQAVTELNSTYRVMPVQLGDDSEPLLIIRVKLYQAFLMSGGPNGRLSRGDELIEMEFFGLDDGDHEFLEAPTCL